MNPQPNESTGMGADPHLRSDRTMLTTLPV